MNFKAILPLTLLVVLLALWVFLWDRPPKDNEELERDILWKLEPTKVERVVFRRGPDLLVAWRDKGRWKVDSIPRESEVLVDSLLDNLCETLSRVPVLMEIEDVTSDPGRYGLEVPEMEVEIFLLDEPRQRRLFFGGPNPRNTARYARTGEEPDKVVLLGALLYWEINESLQTMKRLMAPNPEVSEFQTGLPNTGRART